MYTLATSSEYRRNYKRLVRRGYDPAVLKGVVELLRTGNPLPAKHRDHALQGEWLGYRECHIAGDWLLVYEKDGANLILTLMRTGTHSDLF